MVILFHILYRVYFLGILYLSTYYIMGCIMKTYSDLLKLLQSKGFTAEEAESFFPKGNQKICIVSQTTFNYNKFKELVEKIKQQRKKLKISQIQLASKSGVSLGSIKRFELKYEISLNSFIKILIALNLEGDLENLFTQKSYTSIDEVINGQL